MSYTIIDHGVWRGYTPDPMPQWAVESSTIGGAIVFFKRDSDGIDFYDWMKSNPFASDSIVAQTIVENGNPDNETVKAVFRDPTMLGPFNQRVIEIQGVDPKEDKPHNLFAWMTYNLKTKTLSGGATPPQPPELPTITFKKDIWLRATDDEAHTIDTVLGQQPLRKQKIYNEAQYLNHADPMYTELQEAFEATFGKKRAAELLAGS